MHNNTRRRYTAEQLGLLGSPHPKTCVGVARPEEHRTCRAGITILGQRWLSREPPFRWEPALIPQLLLRTGIDAKRNTIPSSDGGRCPPPTHPWEVCAPPGSLTGGSSVWGCSEVTNCSELFAADGGGSARSDILKILENTIHLTTSNDATAHRFRPPQHHKNLKRNPRSRPKPPNKHPNVQNNKKSEQKRNDLKIHMK